MPRRRPGDDFLTTTAIELDEELLNRCLVLTVNETREQTAAIQHRQRFEDTLEGLLMCPNFSGHEINIFHPKLYPAA